MTEDQHRGPGGSHGWEPLPQGEYDDGATAFVQLPDNIDEWAGPDTSPLAAPGHGYVPPQITVTPAPGGTTDPAATGSWVMPAQEDPAGAAAYHPYDGGQAQTAQDPAVEASWPAFADEAAYGAPQTHGYDYGTGHAPHTGAHTGAHADAHTGAHTDVTGEWSIPVADGSLPDETGEYTSSAIAAQWQGLPPTLPGGAVAPWAAGGQWGEGAQGVPAGPHGDTGQHGDTGPHGDTGDVQYPGQSPYGTAEGHDPQGYVTGGAQDAGQSAAPETARGLGAAGFASGLAAARRRRQEAAGQQPQTEAGPAEAFGAPGAAAGQGGAQHDEALLRAGFIQPPPEGTTAPQYPVHGQDPDTGDAAYEQARTGYEQSQTGSYEQPQSGTYEQPQTDDGHPGGQYAVHGTTEPFAADRWADAGSYAERPQPGEDLDGLAPIEGTAGVAGTAPDGTGRPGAPGADHGVDEHYTRYQEFTDYEEARQFEGTPEYGAPAGPGHEHTGTYGHEDPPPYGIGAPQGSDRPAGRTFEVYPGAAQETPGAGTTDEALAEEQEAAHGREGEAFASGSAPVADEGAPGPLGAPTHFTEGTPAESAFAQGVFADDTFADDTFADDTFADDTFVEGAFAEEAYRQDYADGVPETFPEPERPAAEGPEGDDFAGAGQLPGEGQFTYVEEADPSAYSGYPEDAVRALDAAYEEQSGHLAEFAEQPGHTGEFAEQGHPGVPAGTRHEEPGAVHATVPGPRGEDTPLSAAEPSRRHHPESGPDDPGALDVAEDGTDEPAGSRGPVSAEDPAPAQDPAPTEDGSEAPVNVAAPESSDLADLSDPSETAEAPSAPDDGGTDGGPQDHAAVTEHATASGPQAPAEPAPAVLAEEPGDPDTVTGAATDPQEPESAPQAPTAQGAHTPPVPRDEQPVTSYVLRVNGTDRPVTGAWVGESLLYVLRERLGLAGAKDGCSQGECGACNVQVDGRLVASCLVPAATASGSEVRTVEGLARDGKPSDVQEALTACGAVQCGFCVPGMAMTVHDLLERNPAPGELETRQALCGNLCRCSGYRGVLEAVREVVASRDEGERAAGRVPRQGAAPEGEQGGASPDEQAGDTA